MQELPASLARLQRLRYLNISENAFEAFPEVVTKMRGLIELQLTDNFLTIFVDFQSFEFNFRNATKRSEEL